MSPQRRNLIRLVTASVIVALIIYLSITIGQRDAGQGGEFVAGQAEATVVAPAQYFPGTQLSYVGEGLFTVPVQAPPGTYFLAAGRDIDGCIWVRLNSARVDPKPKDEIATGTLNPGGAPVLITIASTDKAFRMVGSCFIRKVSMK